MNRQYFQDTTLLVGARVSNILLGIVTGILTARLLGPEGRGALATVSQMASLTVAFGHLGVGNAALYYLGRGDHDAGRLINHSVGLGTGLGLVYVLAGLGAFAAWRPEFLSDISVLAVALGLMSIPFTLVQKYVFWILLGMNKAHLRWVVTILEGSLRLALVGSLALAGLMSVENVLGASLIVALAAAGTATFFSSRETGLRPTLDPPLIRASVGFGMMPYLVLCVINLLLRSDVFVIKYFLPTEQLGFYAVGTSIAERVWIVPEALSMALFAQVARTVGRDEKKSMTPIVVRLSAFLAVLCAAILMISAPVLIPLLYSSEFLPAVAPFIALMPGVAMMTVYLLVNADLTARRRADITFTAFLIALALNLGLNFWIVPRLGILGAALSSSLAYTLGTAIQVFRYCRLTGTRPADLLIVKTSDLRLLRDRVGPLLSKLFRRGGEPRP